MFYGLAANTVLILHLAFIAFAGLGALLAVKWRWIPLLQFPAAAWGVFVEITGRVCPLTPLENHLRARAGQTGYEGGFVEHYLLAIIYPSGLTPSWQCIFAGLVAGANLAIYAWLLWRRHRSPAGEK